MFSNISEYYGKRDGLYRLTRNLLKREVIKCNNYYTIVTIIANIIII
jgi:hypothetical protein